MTVSANVSFALLPFSFNNDVLFDPYPWSHTWFRVQFMVQAETTTPDCSRSAWSSLDVLWGVFSPICTNPYRLHSLSSFLIIRSWRHFQLSISAKCSDNSLFPHCERNWKQFATYLCSKTITHWSFWTNLTIFKSSTAKPSPFYYHCIFLLFLKKFVFKKCIQISSEVPYCVWRSILWLHFYFSIWNPVLER